MKKILLIATGGTIASTATKCGLTPGITSQELRDSVSEISNFCTIDAIQLLNIDSTNIQPEHWLMMEETIEQNFWKYDGFVITHGTDTMAYTAAALSYLIQHPGKPIVLTGSQKPLHDPLSDARKNLLDSFWFACQDDVSGVFLVFSGKVILGTRAKKLKSKSYEAFDSVNYPIAAVIDGKRVFRYLDMQEDCEPRFYRKLDPDIFLLKLAPGMNPDILDHVGARYRAIVIESYGVGGIPFVHQRNFLQKLEKISKSGGIIVVATQVILEGSDLDVYEVGAKAIAQMNVLQSRDMTIEAVIAKLMWLLGNSTYPETVRENFYTPVARDILNIE